MASSSIPPATGLERLTRAARALGFGAEAATGTSDGDPQPAVVVQHGGHRLVAMDEGGHLLLTYVLEIPDEDAARLANLNSEDMGALLAVLRRELLGGRTGMEVFLQDEDDPTTFDAVHFHQMLMLPDLEPDRVQRLADGVQELIGLAVRGTDLLSAVLQAVDGTTPTSDHHEGMYG